LQEKTFEPLATAKYLFETLGNAVDADTYCKSIVHYLHEKYGAIACFLTRLDKEAKIRWVGRYGYDIDSSNVAAVSVWDKSASAKSMLSGHPLVAANPLQFEALFGDPRLEHPNGVGFLSIPLKHQGQSIGSMGISFVAEISEDLIADETFEVLAIGASAYLLSLAARNDPVTIDGEPLEDARITSRDIQILNLMNEGLTHYEIGRVLDLSESTIKQTSSYLYKKLGVTKKIDAIDQAKLLRLI
jgi:DNA-binding CsgD family transcriptional regulator